MQLFHKTMTRLSACIILLMAFTYILPSAILAAEQKKFTVIIDAGHGGNDHGAIENDVKEKDINLAVALKLGEMIKKKLKGTQVIYTRDKDEFISLQKRADIANKAHGDLFISLHCNSVDKSNKNRSNVLGATTFIQGHHKDADNMAVAKRENSVSELDADDSAHYSQFNPSEDESFIIYNMTQKKNFQNSYRFANDVQKEMAAAGRYSRGVQQAGFLVLWSTAMPSALIEMDFICNPEQAKFLDSQAGQEKIAGAVFNAVKTYEAYYRKNLGQAPRKEEIAVNVVEEKQDSKAETKADKPSTKKTNEQDAAIIPAATEVAELPGSDSSSKKKSASRRDNSTANRPAVTGHHRRPKAARRQGVSQVTEAVIPITSESGADYVSAIDPAPVEAPQTSNLDKKSTKKTSKKDKKKEADAQKQANKKKTTKKQSISTTYMIVLFISSEELNSDSAQFKGLNPVIAIEQNGINKYVYGESKDRAEIESMLKEVKQIFPDAYIDKVMK